MKRVLSIRVRIPLAVHFRTFSLSNTFNLGRSFLLDFGLSTRNGLQSRGKLKAATAFIRSFCRKERDLNPLNVCETQMALWKNCGKKDKQCEYCDSPDIIHTLDSRHDFGRRRDQGGQQRQLVRVGCDPVVLEQTASVTRVRVEAPEEVVRHVLRLQVRHERLEPHAVGASRGTCPTLT